MLLMSYGTPTTLEEVPAYYTHIRGGRRPGPELLENLVARYRHIGGSPLLRTTRKLAEALGSALEDRAPGRFRVHVGMKHWHPYIKEAVAEIARQGAEALVAIALAPHYSRLSVESYHQAVEEAMWELGWKVPVRFIESWHTHPAFQEILARRVMRALDAFPAAEREQVVVLFSAHSLPERILSWNDPYPEELRESAAAIARTAEVSRWRLAYQSAGRTAEPWLGPDLLRELDSLAAEGARYVLSVPFGFVADHLEVLYDIDVEAQARAQALGITLRRIGLPNADREFVELLADIVMETGQVRERVRS